MKRAEEVAREIGDVFRDMQSELLAASKVHDRQSACAALDTAGKDGAERVLTTIKADRKAVLAEFVREAIEAIKANRRGGLTASGIIRELAREKGILNED